MSQLPPPAAGQKFVEVIEPHELQHLLRQFETFENVTVVRPSELEPHLVDITGAVNIYGQPHGWETKLDLRGLRDAESVREFVGMMQQSFGKAAAQVGRP